VGESMKLKVRDLKELSEYPNEIDNDKRYLLEEIISQSGRKIHARAIAYSDHRESFDYIVEAVNYYNAYIDFENK
jgi:hypothetical protein